jgi:riboflavin kinase/FMN adenylyltransferase
MSLPVIDWETFIDPSRDGGPLALQGDRPLALSVGVFDGVHRGHQRLITKILEYARSHGSLGGLITFRQNPRSVLHPKTYPGDLYGLPQKLRVLEGLGLGFVVLIDFSGDFSRLAGREFAVLLGKRRIGYLAVGVNFRCGYRLDTNAQLLRDMMTEGGTLTELAPQLREAGAPISSSRIREAVLAGDIAGAADLLGRPYGVDLAGLCPAIEGDAFSWDLGKEGRVLPPAACYGGLIRAGAAEFPAEFFVDSGRIFLTRDSVLRVLGDSGGFKNPPGPGDILNCAVLSVEFRPGPRGEGFNRFPIGV